MKLFFDENLSSRLVDILHDRYPNCGHVRNMAMRGETDATIWRYCKRHNFVIVSKDTDFRERSFLQGHPPKVIWLNVGNAGTNAIAKLLDKEHLRINHFIDQQNESLMVLPLSKYKK